MHQKQPPDEDRDRALSGAGVGRRLALVGGDQQRERAGREQSQC
jgi:hypothetical protein